MANLKDLIVNGAARIIGKVYASEFVGKLSGNATTATKLGTKTKGNTTTPIYLNAGVPTAIDYSIGTDVPSNAVFTDTTYSVVGGQNTTGLIKNGSSVTSASGYTACPIVNGIPYYKDTNTTYSVFGKSGSTASTGLVPKPDTTAGSSKYLREDGSWATPPDTNTDTKNTAGSTNTTSKIYLIGATSQEANPQTYSNSSVSVTNGELTASKVHNAIWNDLVDSIPVDEDCNLEHGYCYCFDGEKYTKSSKYLDDGIIGIHSDTYGFKMGSEENKKKMDVSVSGFVLAYIDKEYKPGTPLTCTENGYLTEIKKEDKIEYPEKIVAIYWKNEPAEEWGTEERKIKVNGRKWVKIK